MHQLNDLSGEYGRLIAVSMLTTGSLLHSSNFRY